MRASVLSAALAAVSGASARPADASIAPSLELECFNTHRVVHPKSFLESYHEFCQANATGQQGPDLFGVAQALDTIAQDLTQVGGDITKVLDKIFDLENDGSLPTVVVSGPVSVGGSVNVVGSVRVGDSVSVGGSVTVDGSVKVSGYGTDNPSNLDLSKLLNSRDSSKILNTRATCSSLAIRTEWDAYDDNRKQGYVNAIRCLMGRPPGGAFPESQNRYEDFTALHQASTTTIHGTGLFMVWHRYLLYVFQDVLSRECGFNDAIPWFDETRYAGKFSTSSIFSSQWYGSIGIGGACVTNGVFANLAINIGPGQGNTRHCLTRNGDAAKTANCNSAFVSVCNQWRDYAGMSRCHETGVHAWAHNGCGGAMQDVFASPSDAFFWLHHAFLDRTFRIWQNADPSRLHEINGVDSNGNAITLDTRLSSNGIRPDMTIRDVLDTTQTPLCYKYNY